MKIITATIGMAVWLSCLLAGCAVQSTGDVGKQEFESNCATCHGVSGKGNGPQAQILPTKPADLTVLAKKNGGVFPASHVHEVIDGRWEVAAHGPRTMPVWGEEFLSRETIDPQNVSPEAFASREARVNTRIKALVDYVAELQEK